MTVRVEDPGISEGLSCRQPGKAHIATKMTRYSIIFKRVTVPGAVEVSEARSVRVGIPFFFLFRFRQPSMEGAEPLPDRQD